MINNFSKIIAIGPKVLVEEEVVEEKLGGILLPQEIIDKNQNAQTRGILLQKGGTAFEYLAENEEAPPIGARVFFVKYAGVGEGFDGKYYRMVNDEDIYGY